MANPARRPEPALQAPPTSASPSQDPDARMRDREMEAWLDRAFGSHHADPEPVLRDLD